MSTVKVVDHPVLAHFLAEIAIPTYDNGRLNLLLGPLLEIWTWEESNKPRDANSFKDPNSSQPDSKARIWVSLWDGDSLKLLFTKFATGQSRIASPLPPAQFETDVVPHLPTLVSHLLTLPTFSEPATTGPSLLRSLVGPQPLVLPFLSLWPHEFSPTPGLDIRACSLLTPPPLSSTILPNRHSLTLLKDISNLSSSDLDHVAELWRGFISQPPLSSNITLEQARERVKNQNATMWLYRAPANDDESSEPIPIGFCNLGRPTPRTVAIRGVMVSPLHRGKGIAERMVSLISRTYLIDANPLDYDLSFAKGSTVPEPDPETVYGRKEEVCLFVGVENEVAQRLYKRCGFDESEDRWGDFHLVGVEPGSW